MLDIFSKKSPQSCPFPRHNREEIDCEVYIKRLGKETLRTVHGNISAGGIYLEIEDHDLEKGKKVEIVLVRREGSVSTVTRMRGIIIRIEGNGIAFVTYKKEDLSSHPSLKQDLGLATFSS